MRRSRINAEAVAKKEENGKFAAMKQRDDTSFIRALIAEGEHVRQDFKFEVSDSRKIARSLSAFANTEGGRLLIGVKDNGRIAGVRSEEEMYMVEAAAQVYCTPAVEVEMRVYRPEGRSVLIASVEPAPRKPVMVKEEGGRKLAYVRIADENILASPVHIGVWRCEADNGRGGSAGRMSPGLGYEVPGSGYETSGSGHRVSDSWSRQDQVSVTFTEQERELLAVIAAASGSTSCQSAQSGSPTARASYGASSCQSAQSGSPTARASYGASSCQSARSDSVLSGSPQSGSLMARTSYGASSSTAISRSSSGLTLSQICRRVTIPRRRVIHLLSLFVHWGLVEIHHDSRGFLYYGKD